MNFPLPHPALAATGDPRLGLLSAFVEPAWLVDAALGTVLAANAAAEQWLGRGPLAGLDAEELIPTLEDAAFWQDARAGSAQRLDSETEIPRPDGGLRAVTRRIAPLPLAGLPAMFLVQLQDRSAERAAAREHETALAELRATLEATADAILVTDLGGRIRAFNRRFAALWALPEAVLHAGDDRAVYRWLQMNVMDVDAYDRRLEEVYAHTMAEAEDTLALVNGALVARHAQPQWSQGRPIGRVFSFRELNARRPGAPRELSADGVDQLTQLPNRTGFLQALEGALRGGRAGAGFAVLCAEFDRDALFGDGADGHANARRLSELAGQLRGAVRQPHHCARLGGSRFGVLVTDASEAAAEGAARRLIEQQQRPGGVRVSIGIGCYPGAGLSADEILRHVEIAMHRAQQQSLSAAEVHRFGFESWQRRRDRVEEGLRHAVEQGHLRLVHQARVDGISGETVAIEVQLRWRDRELGEVPATQFLSVARERGLIGPLDDWALERGLLHARRWRAAGQPWRLNVNISGWQLVQPGHARRVAAALAAAGWKAEDLEIDLTEDALEADPEAAVAAVRALSRMGVRVMLQAFGAGTTSLAWLRRLPLAGVKLDAGLAQVAVRGDAEGAWVGALVNLARALGMEVHAEGVDSDEQRQALVRAGCRGLQGRWVGPWMEARALDTWLAPTQAAPGEVRAEGA